MGWITPVTDAAGNVVGWFKKVGSNGCGPLIGCLFIVWALCLPITVLAFYRFAWALGILGAFLCAWQYKKGNLNIIVATAMGIFSVLVGLGTQYFIGFGLLMLHRLKSSHQTAPPENSKKDHCGSSNASDQQWSFKL